jgi:ankyrin repeat protein
MFNQTDIVRLLLDHGAEVNARNSWNFTALHNAVAHNQTKIVVLLLRRGADVNAATNGNGQIPMYYAVGKCFPGVVELLLLNTNQSLAMIQIDSDGSLSLYIAAQATNCFGRQNAARTRGGRECATERRDRASSGGGKH